MTLIETANFVVSAIVINQHSSLGSTTQVRSFVSFSEITSFFGFMQ